MANRWSIPNLGFGVGLRTVHFPHILANQPPVDWFEVLSENFLEIVAGVHCMCSTKWRNVTR
jgi:uncharacterized protein